MILSFHITIKLVAADANVKYMFNSDERSDIQKQMVDYIILKAILISPIKSLEINVLSVCVKHIRGTERSSINDTSNSYSDSFFAYCLSA